MSLLALIATLTLDAAAQIPAVHGALQLTPPGEVLEGTPPVLGLAVPDRDAVIYVSCTIGEERKTWTSEVIPAGEGARFELPLVPGATQAECELVARFANGLSERRAETVTWTWKAPPPPPEDAAPPPEDAAPPAEEPLPPPPPPEPAPVSP